MDDFSFTRRKFREIRYEVLKSKGVIFDFRNLNSIAKSRSGDIDYFFQSNYLDRYLASEEINLPTTRERMHKGFKPESGTTSGGYYSSFDVHNYETIYPTSRSINIPIIFIINSKSDVPFLAWGLKEKGLAKILYEDDGNSYCSGNSINLKLLDQLSANIRVNEVIFSDGSSNFEPDKVFSQEEDILSKAMNELKEFYFSKTTKKKESLNYGTYVYKRFPWEDFPSKEYKLLAAFKIWTIFNYFFPYKDLMDSDWDEVLLESIPKFEKATNKEEFRNAVCEMLAYTQDSHVSAWWRNKNTAMPMLSCTYIEDKLIVDNIYSQDFKNLVLPGDEVISINNKTISELEQISRKRKSESTEQAMKLHLSQALFYGADSSEINIEIKNHKNKHVQIKTIRKYEIWDSIYSTPKSNSFKAISSEIGYADLSRLNVSEVDSMFEIFKNTKSIIFDLRGYPRGTAMAIAPRLNQSRKKIYGALFERPILSPENLIEDLKHIIFSKFYQPIPESNKTIYNGKVIVLINENTMSQAEHTCLIFNESTNVTFIGSPTMGANGDVTNFNIPGNISISMTGQSVKHVNGDQLQRVGILPDIEVKPTVKGVKAGIDEVLERAILFAKEGK